MRKIEINLSTRKYNFYIESGSLDRVGETLMETADPGTRVMVVADDMVDSLYGNRVAGSLSRAGFNTQSFIFPAGETSKNLANVNGLLEKMAENLMTRDDLIIALGGGVSMDLAGFAASLYCGGIDHVRIPTTFLAAVDCCVNGRSCINLENGGNVVWTKHHPVMVICDPESFKTLEPELFAEGTAEAIKYALVGDKRMFSRLSRATFQTGVEDIIEDCARLEARILEEDEEGMGRGQLLDLGHTFARAIEEVSQHRIHHGSAVAMGMLMAAKAGVSMGFTGSDMVRKINEALIRNGLPTKCKLEQEDIVSRMRWDRTRKDEMIDIVFPVKVGKCEVQRIHTDNLTKIVHDAMENELYKNMSVSDMEQLEESKVFTDEDVVQQVLVAAAVAGRKTVFRMSGSSENIQTLVECLKELGVGIEVRNENMWQIAPITEEKIREKGDFLPIINCGNNETAFRILVPIMAATNREVFVSGTGDLARTPFEDIIGVMEPKGCVFRFDHFPFELSGSFTGGRFELPADTNRKFLSGLLMALPMLKENSEIVLEEGYEHYSEAEDTLHVLEEFGIRIQRSGNIFIIKGGQKYISPAGFDLSDLV